MPIEGSSLVPAEEAWIAQYVKTCRTLGFRVNPGTVDDYVALVAASIRDRVRCTVFSHNLHSLHEYFRSPALRECFRQPLALVDGMPIIWLLQLAGHDVDRSHRLTYVDFIWPLLTRARDAGWRVFVIGQPQETLDAALDVIRGRCPGIQIHGRDGFFDKTAGGEESLAVVDEINRHGTDLLLVGMGTPIQEQWVHAHAELIEAPVILTPGACMEYVAGAVKTPPRWMGRCGLEWSYRLLENPRRFAYRYLVEPWVLALFLMRNLLAGSRP